MMIFAAMQTSNIFFFTTYVQLTQGRTTNVKKKHSHSNNTFQDIFFFYQTPLNFSPVAT